MAVIKIGARELPPLFMAGLRSFVASGCLYIWMKAKGISVFPSKGILIHGVVIGLLFGSEFGLIYVGLEYTLASRTIHPRIHCPVLCGSGRSFLP